MLKWQLWVDAYGYVCDNLVEISPHLLPLAIFATVYTYTADFDFYKLLIAEFGFCSKEIELYDKKYLNPQQIANIDSSTKVYIFNIARNID